MVFDKSKETKAERKARKAAFRAAKLQQTVDKRVGRMTQAGHHVNVLCVRFGNKYGADYVVKLRNMVERHLTLPYTFHCLTDDPRPLQGVNSIVQKNKGYAKGWWHKVQMFDPHLPISGKILYLDLDVIVCNSLDKFFTVYPNDFLGIRDFNRKFHTNFQYLNSSVMHFSAGTQTHIYNMFQANPSNAMRMQGDQDWIWSTSKSKIKFWPDNWVQSYKWEIRSRNELGLVNGHRQFKTVRDDIVIDPNCSIAVFHGDPNPAAVQDKFVATHWK